MTRLSLSMVTSRGRQGLAEGGDDGGGGLLAGAVAQGHVGNPGRAGCPGDAGVAGDLEGGGLGGRWGKGARPDMGARAFGVVDHSSRVTDAGTVPLSLSFALVSIWSRST
jgi:hypothetical protein